MKVKRESDIAQLCPTPSDPINCSLPGSSVHGIFQARVLEWGAIGLQVPKPELSTGLLDMLILGLHTRSDGSVFLSEDQKLMF